MKMKRMLKIALPVALAAGFLLLGAMTSVAQDKPASNMQILMDKIKADKKLLVSQNMELTDAEAQQFWPVYEEYQKELKPINQKMLLLIESYATDYRNKTLTDEKAKKLISGLVEIQKDEIKLTESIIPKLEKKISAIKTARYLQIEHKIRSAVKYQLAEQIPLMQ